MADTRWKKSPIMGGLYLLEAEFYLTEVPARGHHSVTTRAHATVAPDFDWRTNGVLWGVVFRRYVPKDPLMPREIRNRTTGEIESKPPPPIIPERNVGGRVQVSGADDAALWGAIEEAKYRCDQTVKGGRPEA